MHVCSLQGARGQTRCSKRDEAQARTTTRFYAPCVGSAAEAHISGDADAVGVALGGTGEGDSDPIPVRFLDPRYILGTSRSTTRVGGGGGRVGATGGSSTLLNRTYVGFVVPLQGCWFSMMVG